MSLKRLAISLVSSAVIVCLLAFGVGAVFIRGSMREFGRALKGVHGNVISAREGSNVTLNGRSVASITQIAGVGATAPRADSQFVFLAIADSASPAVFDSAVVSGVVGPILDWRRPVSVELVSREIGVDRLQRMGSLYVRFSGSPNSLGLEIPVRLRQKR